MQEIEYNFIDHDVKLSQLKAYVWVKITSPYINTEIPILGIMITSTCKNSKDKIVFIPSKERSYVIPDKYITITNLENDPELFI